MVIARPARNFAAQKRDGPGFRRRRLGWAFGAAQHEYAADERTDGKHVAWALASPLQFTSLAARAG